MVFFLDLAFAFPEKSYAMIFLFGTIISAIETYLENFNIQIYFYYSAEKCDKANDCIDSSDEFSCKCADDEFTCICFSNRIITCSHKQACIPLTKYRDGKKDCPDGSDEIVVEITKSCKNSSVVFSRLLEIDTGRGRSTRRTKPTGTKTNATDSSTKTEATDTIFQCSEDEKCFETPYILCNDLKTCNMSEKICSCLKIGDADCGLVFQCASGGLIIAPDFCNSKQDCDDSSDEIRNQPGFRCSQTSCVLPQRNLYDNVSHCLDESDLCFNGKNICFECFDKLHWISRKQVCDGIIDCYDLSDECLCEANLNQHICNLAVTSFADISHFENEINKFELINAIIQLNNRITLTDLEIEVNNDAPNRITCQSRSGDIYPIFCDGRPECRDLSDECSCENPPGFCLDPCHKSFNSFYPIGDRYCDGKIDTVWRFFNRSDCPRGFDEALCSQRFNCKSGDFISIDISQVCDGTANCNNGEDEIDCAGKLMESTVFSSDTEMIENVGLRCAFWIIGLLVIAGNGIALAFKVFHLKNSKLTDSLFCQHLIVANISLADFLMGVYLLVIAIFSAIYSGYYGQVDHEWRTSISCSIIGSLAVISSEASCFLMVLLSAFRLYNVWYPVKSMTSSVLKWKIGICVLWLVAIILAILPILHQVLIYFVRSIFFPTPFSSDGVWSKNDFQAFARRYGAYTGKAITDSDNVWESANMILKEHFPEAFPLKFFGYYGETSICMPRFFVGVQENAWEFTMILITINFLSFSCIAAGYILIFVQTSNTSKLLKTNQSAKKESVLQKRIARLIATDFFCWIPICIMAYLRLAGVEFSDIVYQITAVFLLPINSVLNPFLYSPLPDKLFLCTKKQPSIPSKSKDQSSPRCTATAIKK